MIKIYLISATYVDELRVFEDKMTAMLADREAYSAYADEDDDETPANYQVINGIALYSIQGKMLSSGNWVTRMFGMSSYDQIGDDLARMSQDESVEQVLIAMDTPGGAVAGIADISDTWQRLNAEKPITVHTAGNLASAGVWTASNSKAIYASETAEVGSIGVIMQHVSQEKALDKAGIKVTEIKSSPLKHVGSPAKDLTPEEKAHLQEKVMESAGLFKKQMYKTRPGITEEAFSGEMFSASDALRLGLIDGINTYSGVFEQLSASADSDNNYSYKEDFGMKRKVTAAMAEAAISAGADPETLEIVSDEVYAALPEAEKEIIAPIEGDESNEDEGEETILNAEALAAEVVTMTEQVDGLTQELATAMMQVDTLTTEVASLTGKLELSAADPLRVIAEERVGVMRTALGMVSIEMTAFSTESLLAEYTALTTQFKKAYKSGGHKPVSADEAKPVVKKAVVTSIDTARFKSTGI